jgi:hypothetical protein
MRAILVYLLDFSDDQADVEHYYQKICQISSYPMHQYIGNVIDYYNSQTLTYFLALIHYILKLSSRESVLAAYENLKRAGNEMRALVRASGNSKIIREVDSSLDFAMGCFGAHAHGMKGEWESALSQVKEVVQLYKIIDPSQSYFKGTFYALYACAKVKTVISFCYTY